MIKRYICLLIILISSFVLSIIYREDAPQYLLLIEIVFILITHLFALLNFLVFSFKGCQIPGSIRIGIDDASKRTIKCSIRGGIFPFKVKNTITFQINSINNTKLTKLAVPFYADRFDKIIEFPVNIEEIGVFVIKPVKITVFDASGLIGISKKIKVDSSELIVYPKCCKVNVSDMSSKVISGLSEGNDDKFYTDHPGDDPSEIFGFREYKEGDKPSHINWKLSAREKKLIVKEMSDPIKEKVCVIWNNTINDSRYYNAIMTTFFSVISGIMQEGLALAVLNNIKDGIIHLTEHDDVEGAMMHAFKSVGVNFAEINGELTDEGILRAYSSIVYITDQDSLFDFDDDRIRVIKLGVERSCEINIDRVETDLNKLWLEIR